MRAVSLFSHIIIAAFFHHNHLSLSLTILTLHSRCTAPHISFKFSNKTKKKKIKLNFSNDDENGELPFTIISLHALLLLSLCSEFDRFSALCCLVLKQQLTVTTTTTKKTVPEWLDQLLRENFFTPCSDHQSARKNEKNVFCVDCAFSLCSQCCISHSSHRLLQVRRNVYHDVIRLDDAEKLLDCSHIQSYTSNGAKVLFLNQRPTNRPHTDSGNICGGCDRILQHPFFFCSISCKVDHILTNEGIESLLNHLRRCDFIPFPDVAHFGGGGLLTPDSVLEQLSNSVSVLSSSNSSGPNAVVSKLATAIVSTATTVLPFPRKKRTPKLTIRVDPVVSNGSSDGSGEPIGDNMHHTNKRRKRRPQRSPLV
ncbi:unnamed protein product [Rhodiola kirilowii]